MTDWDKRVSDAVEKIDLGYWSLNPAPREFEMAKDCFIAGAKFTRGLLTDTPGGKRIYGALNEIDALSLQCEAMASSLEYARNCVENFNIINLEAKAAESKLNEALTAYKKFKEGG